MKNVRQCVDMAYKLRHTIFEKRGDQMHIFDESKAVFDEKGSMLLEKPEAKYATISEPGRVVMDNLLARATTKWTLEETKLFLLAVSKIQEIDEKNEVKLNKKEVMNYLEMDPRNATWYMVTQIL